MCEGEADAGFIVFCSFVGCAREVVCDALHPLAEMTRVTCGGVTGESADLAEVEEVPCVFAEEIVVVDAGVNCDEVSVVGQARWLEGDEFDAEGQGATVSFQANLEAVPLLGLASHQGLVGSGEGVVVVECFVVGEADVDEAVAILVKRVEIVGRGDDFGVDRAVVGEESDVALGILCADVDAGVGE